MKRIARIKIQTEAHSIDKLDPEIRDAKEHMKSQLYAGT
jgi:hypothetical protein